MFGILDTKLAALYIVVMSTPTAADCVIPAPSDDDHLPMTVGERSAWATGILVPLATVGYLAVVLPQLASTPASEIAWQVPLIVSLVVAIAGTIVATVLSAIIAAVIARAPEAASDIRDRQIERRGDAVGAAVTGAGLAVLLVLAMIGIDHFWIGTTIAVGGAIGAASAAFARIRAYRRSFHG